MVPETGNKVEFARYFFAVLGHGGLGFSPFGMDLTGYANYPLGAAKVDSDIFAQFGRNYLLMEPMMRPLARLSFAGKVWGASEPTDTHEQRIALGRRWQVNLSYGRPQFGTDPPTGNKIPAGGALIAELAPDEFLVTGFQARVNFESAQLDGKRFMLARVEEGHYDVERWVFERVWNGDQTDWGLNFTSAAQLLKVRLATY